MKPGIILFCLLTLFAVKNVIGQSTTFSHGDSLRGTNGVARTWWNLLRYDVAVTPDYAAETITGSNLITFAVTRSEQDMQIDLQEPLQIKSVMWQGQSLSYRRDGNAFFVRFPKALSVGVTDSIRVVYDGHPVIAKRPPWDGGWIFTHDKLGRPWMTVACEGLGASVWMPCKDWLGDEPENGASLSITVADTLIAIGNGRLTGQQKNGDGTTTSKWEVKNPINNYNIIPYIGKYVHWHEDYMGEKGKLDCDYWVLDYNLDVAKKQFLAVDSMLRCFEFWMGPYPFYEDGYKLIESPHLGMEHQSAIAYGNKFRYGYSGKDLSGSGWGMKWDFIIVHESGHEWFGNNITAKDLADEWIHEGFTNYTETLYTGYYFGAEAATAYLTGIRKNITNASTIIGHYGVNKGPDDTDEYYKGGNLLHTIRTVINDDSLFRKILRGLNKEFYHQTVSTNQIENYISRHSGIQLRPVFDQYLRTTKIPVLEYVQKGDGFDYRWTNCVAGFNLPARVNGKWLKPTEKWQHMNQSGGDANGFVPDPNMYFDVKRG